MSAVPVGVARSEVVIGTLTATDIVRYAGAAGEFTVVHHDDAMARRLGYGGVFAHGMLTMGAAGRVVTDWFGLDAVREFSARFLATVQLGDTVTASASVTDIRSGDDDALAELEIVATNQDGTVVLTGSVVVALEPRR